MAVIDSPFEWEGTPLPTVGNLLDAACKAEREGKAAEFIAAYRAHTEHADSNLGYIIGYLEPAERRQQMYAAFQLGHPVFGGTP